MFKKRELCAIYFLVFVNLGFAAAEIACEVTVGVTAVAAIGMLAEISKSIWSIWSITIVSPSNIHLHIHRY
jgi:hypothetical protein